MINERVQNALNQQLNAELYSSYLYLAMSAHFESVKLKGFANWMQVQTQEELIHAMKFYYYLADQGARITLTAIDAPPTQWKSALDSFEHTYKHEQKVTGLIDRLVELASAESDHVTKDFLQWFVDEQVEEEESAHGIVQKIKNAGEKPDDLLILDQELGKRVFKLPKESA